jgi:membrane dipeptidase
MSYMPKNNFLRPTRREFLSTATYAGAAALISPAWIKALAAPVDPRVAQVMAKTIGIDMHNHVYPAGTEPHPHFGPPPGAGPQGGPPAGGSSPQQEQQPTGPELSIEQEIKLSGFNAVAASYVLDFAPNKKPGDALQNFLSWLTAIDAQLAKDHMHRALDLKDLETAHAQNKPTIVQTVEGAMFIEGKLENIEVVYERGVRHLQLLHMADDLVSPLGDVRTGKAHLGGLTPFGAEVIKECNRLGILVDMAHATPETVAGAIKASSQPIVYSHTGLDSQLHPDPKLRERMKEHLMTPEHATVISDAGGIVGLWPKMTNSPKDYVATIKELADAIGVDHVGIGSDTDLLSSKVGQGTNKAWPNLSGGFFNATVAEMLSQGFTPDDISKVGGGNYCRVFGNATAGHA